MTVPTHLWICGWVRPIDGSDMRGVDLPSIAKAMSYIHRFNGQMGPASLTDHSVRVAGRLPDVLKLAGLLHDIGEIVTGDIAAPIKHMCPDVVTLEKAWRAHLVRHLFPWRSDDLLEEISHHLVKEADSLDYADEVRLYTARKTDPPYSAASSADRWIQEVRRCL